MKTTRIIYLTLAGVLLLALAISCPACSGIKDGITKVTDVITQPSAREVYAREFKDNKEAYAIWESSYKAAVTDSLSVVLPYGEKGTFSPSANAVYSYSFTLKEGEVLAAGMVTDSASRVFIDVFEQGSEGYRYVESAPEVASAFTFTPSSGGVYKIIVQPEIAASGNFFLSLTKKPLYAFPVSGKGNAAIGSFWGMDRDGGKRRHEGIDIFAKRGTPVVAVTDGYVSYTGERGLGGKQVWLRDGIFGKSLYYAHLDSVATESGKRVKAGDTLGFVGNTGNAKFTPPHLHFGIYRMGGAVDPLPYVYTTEELSAKQFPQNFKSNTLKLKSRANLRQGPGTATAVIGALSANDTVTILGQAKDWLHIKTPLNTRAFLHKSLVK